MTKIILPKELTLKDSPFFTQILQASSRGDVLVWNDDYTEATLTLATDAFFTDNDAKAIVEKGGEVEGYPYWSKVKKTDFENTLIPDALLTYADVFEFTRPVLETNENGDIVETEYIEYLNSANHEYLPMSITTKII